MLDDLPGLRDAAEGYRAAATAAGIAWAQHAGTQAAQPPELVYRLCDVDRVPGQLTWFQSQGWELERLLPDGGWVMPWPADIDEALDNLSFALATPFPWRQQLPLFNFEIMLYTFVLADEHQGEIWRYEIRPDTWQSARAATSLGALLTEWRRGIEAGVVFLPGRRPVAARRRRRARPVQGPGGTGSRPRPLRLPGTRHGRGSAPGAAAGVRCRSGPHRPAGIAPRAPERDRRRPGVPANLSRHRPI
jgi:hypothetical protein